jgi:glutamate-5-semialdehyde dehydrogenase
MSTTVDVLKTAQAARTAGQQLAQATAQARDECLRLISRALREHLPAVIEANRRDLEEAEKNHLEASTKKRLVLNEEKVEDLIAGLEQLVSQPDPIGVVSLHRQLSPGLILRRETCPIGVLCNIFEARPEAVIQIASLAIKSGNALILKGGKEASHSNQALVDLVREAIGAASKTTTPGGLAVPIDAVQLVSTREDISELLKLDTLIDLVIPRGSNALVKSVKSQTKIPVLGHADGICHAYLDKSADVMKAAPIVVDAKTQYPAACNAAECLLIHEGILTTVFPTVAAALLSVGVTLHCDEVTMPIAEGERAKLQGGSAAAGSSVVGSVITAQESDWTTEWLSFHMSVKAVKDVTAAIDWVNAHGSHHTDIIVAEDAAAANVFLSGVDSACCYHNASSRFSDGYRYGFGAEVGISTNRIHARGPVGLEGLMSYKYRMVSDSVHTVSQFAAAASAAGGSGEASVTVGGVSLPALKFEHKDLPISK